MTEEHREKERSLRINVELHDLEPQQEWPEIIVYLFNRTGRLIAEAPIRADPDKQGSGVATVTYKGKEDEESLTVKVGPKVEELKLLAQQRLCTHRLRELPRKRNILTINIAKLVWICWIKFPYHVTGTVEKQTDGQKNPVCLGEVDIYDVDLYCFLKLPDLVIERIRDGIIDLVLDPPPFDIPGLKELPAWWDDEDDGWCGTPPGPHPPIGSNILAKVAQLPREWSFATNRVAALDTARTRLDQHLSTMSITKKQSWLNSETAGDVKLSEIVYSNTQQFRTLLIEKFHVFRYWLCWYPWIHWLWWQWCRFYGMQKIGTAVLQPDGSFSTIIWISVCDHDKPDLWFRVRQKVDGTERVIYARYPVLCHTYWNHPGGKPVNLLVTDQNAVICEKDGQPDKQGVYVMPLGIGNDGWYDIEQAHLKSGDIPNANRGLYNASDPYGTTLHFRMQFHDDLQSKGVHYYRWSYAPAGTSNWTFISAPVTHRYLTRIGTDFFIVPEELGPFAVNGTASLFKVPDPGKDWIALSRNDRAFAIWRTALWDSDLNRYLPQVADGRYTLRLEMFDAAGNNLDPTTAGSQWKFFLPTAGASGGVWPVDTDPNVQPGGSVYFNIWVDNTDTVADIQSVGLGGTPTGECQFIEYSDAKKDTVSITYVAYHQQPPARDFLAHYNLSIKRGISGTTAAAYSSVIPAHSPATLTFATDYLLRKIGAKGPYSRCTFAVELHTWPRTRNGYSHIRQYEDHDTSAFALMKP
ncbi:MAG TPA: hypothetical protein ENG91_07970 [Desulfobacteraceae bacterium]|nr:hypothetical protein [Desulfobacteraceae bacterium]